jgi:endonuclease/exonuclease/phosphatase family metal-dependent hydrolase
VAATAIDGPLRPEIDVSRPAPPPPAPGVALRLVTFNVHFGEDVEGLADALAGAAATARMDLLLVQEIESYPAEGRSRAARLAARLDMDYVYAPARLEQEGTHGLAILSRFPLERIEVMSLPHLDLSFRARDRIAVAADVVVGDRRLRIVNVHLDTRANITERIVQLHPAVDDLEEQVVVAGDFNTNPYVWLASAVPLTSTEAISGFDQAVALDDYMAAMGFDTPTSESGPTQDASVVELRLDAVYSRGVATGALGVAREVTLSDHAPLWIDVDLGLDRPAEAD